MKNKNSSLFNFLIAYFFVLTTILLGSIESLAQCNTYTAIPLISGATSTNGRAPCAGHSRSRAVYLVRPSDMAAAVIGPGLITGIGWTYNTVPAIAASGPLVIYLQNTSDVTNTKSTTWATAISGMTIVANATYNLGTSKNLTLNFTGGSPFNYTGGGVYVAFDWGCNTTVSPVTIECNSSVVNSLLGAQSTAACPGTPASTLAASNFRPETKFIMGYNIEGVISTVHTNGKLANGHSTNHQISASITNQGISTITNLPVTLNVSGVNTINEVQTIPSLAPCSTSTVTFNSYTPSAIGDNTITVSIPADDNNVNNSKNIIQHITTTNIAFKDDGQANTGGVGFNSALGTIAAKFTTAEGGQLQAVNVGFTNGTSTFRLVVFGDNGGLPGSILYEDPADRTNANGPLTINPFSPVYLPAGSFYIGLRQTATSNMGLSYTRESPLRPATFFTSTTNPEVNWSDQSPGTFRSNIEVQLSQACSTVNIDDGNVCTADACNPSTGIVSHTPVDVNDGNACTTDGCNTSTGITHDPVNTDDGNICTDDVCNSISGVSHTPVNTDDGDACTQDGCNSVTGIFHTPICNDVTFNSNIFIQGFYSGGGLMQNAGSGCLFVVGVPGASSTDVDTVTISVMNASSPYSLIQSKKGILQTNGKIGVTFTAPVSVGNSYYIRLTHRNSIDTWSKFPVLLSSNTTYNFSTALSQAYGDNQADIGGGLFAIQNGDINLDGAIDGSDFLDIDGPIQAGDGGYAQGDINGDGAVDGSDFLVLDSNIQIGVGVVTP